MLLYHYVLCQFKSYFAFPFFPSSSFEICICCAQLKLVVNVCEIHYMMFQTFMNIEFGAHS